ncbi:6008_t:CDS:1, partial [Funneliformis caledonium]
MDSASFDGSICKYKEKQEWIRYLENLNNESHSDAEKEGVISPIKDDENFGIYVALK